LINDIILQGERTKMAFESPPLWVWAIIVGVLIASKFIYRWRATKELARESQEKQERTERAEGKALQAVLSDNILKQVQNNTVVPS
jgi:hypothetical protein